MLVPFLGHEFNPSKCDGEVMLGMGSGVFIYLQVSVNFLDHNCANGNLSVRWILLFITRCESKRRDKGNRSHLSLLQRWFCRERVQGSVASSAHFADTSLGELEPAEAWPTLAGSCARRSRSRSYLAAGESAEAPRAFPAAQPRSKHGEREKRAGTCRAHEMSLCASQIRGEVNFYPVREFDS